MLQIEEGYTNNPADFEEINSSIIDVATLDISPVPHQKNNGFQNPEKLSFKNRLAMFFIGFSYGGLFLIEILGALIVTGLIEDNKPLANIVLESFAYGVLFIIFLVIAFQNKKHFIEEFKGKHKWINGLILGFVCLALELLLSTVISVLFPSDTNANQAVVESLTKSYPTIMLIVTVIIGPMCEELTYRVGLYGALREKNKNIAFIVSGLLFALMHMSFTDTTLLAELTALPIYLLIAYFLNYAYEKHGLACSYVTHMILNLMSFIAIMSI